MGMPGQSRPVQPLEPSTISALAALAGGVLALALRPLGQEAYDGAGTVLLLLAGPLGVLASRKAPRALGFWAAWTTVSLAFAALDADSFALALVAAGLPFLLFVRRTSAALRAVGGAASVLVLMVAAAVATRRLGAYGTVAGLGWALLTALYFTLWAVREPSAKATGVAWAFGLAWSAACLGVAISDAIRFHDAQAFVALAMTGLAAVAVAAAVARHVATQRGRWLAGSASRA